MTDKASWAETEIVPACSLRDRAGDPSLSYFSQTDVDKAPCDGPTPRAHSHATQQEGSSRCCSRKFPPSD